LESIEYMGMPLMGHELLFIARILLEDYLIGIFCPRCNNKELKQIEKLLKKNKMEHVKLFTKSKYLPKINELNLS